MKLKVTHRVSELWDENQVRFKICSHRELKNRGEVIDVVIASALIPVSAAFLTGWYKEACARRELP